MGPTLYLVEVVRLFSDNLDGTHLASDSVDRWRAAAHSANTTSAAPPRVYKVSRRIGVDASAEIIRRYGMGETAQQLADDFNVAKNSITKLLRENSATVRRQPPTPEQRMLLIDGYQAGATIAELEQRYGIPHSTIGRTLHDAGVTVRNRGGRPLRVHKLLDD